MIFAKVDGEQAANLANFFDYGGILGGISCGILNDKTSECVDSSQNCINLTRQSCNRAQLLCFLFSEKPAITCAIMLTMAIPCLLLYQALVSDW